MGLVPVRCIDVGFCIGGCGKIMIVEYDVIVADNLLKLIKYVRQQIKSGWEPLGGPTTSKNGEHYVQAIVRKSND